MTDVEQTGPGKLLQGFYSAGNPPGRGRQATSRGSAKTGPDGQGSPRWQIQSAAWESPCNAPRERRGLTTRYIRFAKNQIEPVQSDAAGRPREGSPHALPIHRKGEWSRR